MHASWCDWFLFVSDGPLAMILGKNSKMVWRMFNAASSANKSPASNKLSSRISRSEGESPDKAPSWLTSSPRLGGSQGWNQAVTEAEKVVNYPTSFLSLRFLLKDEISNLAMHLKRLIGTKHPVINTAKNLLHSHQQTRGLVALLCAKAIPIREDLRDHETVEAGNRMSDISKKQRKLAEIIDQIHVAHIIHRGLLELNRSDMDITPTQYDDLHFGNQVSILIGDYLLAQASSGLAQLRNPEVQISCPHDASSSSLDAHTHTHVFSCSFSCPDRLWG